MLPVVVGLRPTLHHIFWYTVSLVGGSLLLYPAGAVGELYLVVAALLGVWLIAGAAGLRRQPSQAMRFFGFSNLYLALIFGAIALDVLLL